MDLALTCTLKSWISLGLLLFAVAGNAEVHPGLKLRADAERRAAVSNTGTTVCSPTTIGIGLIDWVKGTVVAVQDNTLRVRIDTSARYGQRIGGIELKKDAVVNDTMANWMPCVQ
jgi:hypothetical protein